MRHDFLQGRVHGVGRASGAQDGCCTVNQRYVEVDVRAPCHASIIHISEYYSYTSVRLVRHRVARKAGQEVVHGHLGHLLAGGVRGGRDVRYNQQAGRLEQRVV